MDIYKLRHTLKLILKVFRKYRGQFALLSVMGFLAGAFGSFGISTVIPLFTLMSGEQIIGGDLISQMISRFFSIFNLPVTLPLLLILMVVLFVLKSLTWFLANYLGAKFGAQYEKDMRLNMFDKVIHSNWLHIIEQKPSHIERVLMGDVGNSSSVLTYVNTIILTLASLAIYIFVAFSISTPITLITLLVGIIIFFALKRIFYRTRKIGEKLSKTEKRTAQHVLESIFGMKVVKSLTAEEKIMKLAEEDFEDLEKRRVESSVYHSVVGSITEPVGIVFIAILFILNYRSPDFNIASFAAIIYLVQKMFSFIQSIQGKIHAINGIVPYMQVMLEYWEAAGKNQEVDGDVKKFEFKDKVEFKNMSFAYGETSPVLKNINLDIKKSQMIGIIGPSGGGKTTLVDLILRLFAPSSGEILIDGQNINSINLKSWRKNIGYVSQDIFLINDTIANNIKFHDDTISDDQVIQASKMANIFEFVESLPEKFNTIVGERGIKLSGGQRQRITLARTLARRPEILIMDEATSSLDNDSEALIQKAVKELQGKITLIIIAHRLSTVQNVDKLYVIDKGEVIESGDPNQLLNNPDSYFSKVYTQ